MSGGIGMAEVVALRRDRRAVSMPEATEGLLTATDLAASTTAVYEGTILMLQLDLDEDLAVDGVTTPMIEAHLRERHGEAAPATYNRNLASISSLFTRCVANDLIVRSPAKGLRRRKARRKIEAERQGRAIPLDVLEVLWSDPGTSYGTGCIKPWPTTPPPELTSSSASTSTTSTWPTGAR